MSRFALLLPIDLRPRQFGGATDRSDATGGMGGLARETRLEIQESGIKREMGVMEVVIAVGGDYA